MGSKLCDLIIVRLDGLFRNSEGLSEQFSNLFNLMARDQFFLHHIYFNEHVKYFYDAKTVVIYV